jgi:hypothetical protein
MELETAGMVPRVTVDEPASAPVAVIDRVWPSNPLMVAVKLPSAAMVNGAVVICEKVLVMVAVIGSVPRTDSARPRTRAVEPSSVVMEMRLVRISSRPPGTAYVRTFERRPLLSMAWTVTVCGACASIEAVKPPSAATVACTFALVALFTISTVSGLLPLTAPAMPVTFAVVELPAATLIRVRSSDGASGRPSMATRLMWLATTAEVPLVATRKAWPPVDCVPTSTGEEGSARLNMLMPATLSAASSIEPESVRDSAEPAVLTIRTSDGAATLLASMTAMPLRPAR